MQTPETPDSSLPPDLPGDEVSIDEARELAAFQEDAITERRLSATADVASFTGSGSLDA
jgi:hypothetical protein